MWVSEKFLSMKKKIVENIKALVGAVNNVKPSGAKGTYMKKVSISSTMGPSVTLDVGALLTV